MPKSCRWLQASLAALLLFTAACSADRNPKISELSRSSIDPERPRAPGEGSTEGPQNLPRDFSGINLRLLTMDAPQIQSAFRQRAQEFEAMTGVQIEIQTLPFAQLHDGILADAQSLEPAYDIVSFVSQWLPDYVDVGYLLDLSEPLQRDRNIRWNDIVPFYRNFAVAYGGRAYAVPMDGDFLMVFYRTDLLEQAGLEPPATWDDYLAIARRFQNQDLNADGTLDYGSCIAKKPSMSSFWMFWAMASPMLQTLGTRQGAFLDVETLEPLVRNPAMAKALEMYRASGDYGPPDEMTLAVNETRSRFIAGRCALTLDWGDPGTLALDPVRSQVRDRVGAVIMPGSRDVLDRFTRKLVPCDKIRCPYAIDGINYAPYAASGGWTAGINAAVDEAHQAAAYAFLSYVSQPAQSNRDVTLGSTGFNPYRLSQLHERGPWLEAGMGQEMASKYLGAIEISLSSKNIVLDLRIPQAQRYQQEVLDQILAKFLAGTLTQEEALDQLYDGWEALTHEADRTVQRRAYRLSLGLSPEPKSSESEVP